MDSAQAWFACNLTGDNCEAFLKSYQSATAEQKQKVCDLVNG